jgi:hypothetical protein
VDSVKRSEQIEGFSYYTFPNSALSLNPALLHLDVLADGWDRSRAHKSFILTTRTALSVRVGG